MNKFLTLFALIGFAFIVGHQFAMKEVCEKSGRSFEYDFGVCK